MSVEAILERDRKRRPNPVKDRMCTPTDKGYRPGMAPIHSAARRKSGGETLTGEPPGTGHYSHGSNQWIECRSH